MDAVVGTHPLVCKVVLPRGDHGSDVGERCYVVQQILERTAEIVLWLAYARRGTRSQCSTEGANGFAEATCGHGASLGQRLVRPGTLDSRFGFSLFPYSPSV